MKFNENKWRYDEIWRKLMKISENRWKEMKKKWNWMKFNENQWKFDEKIMKNYIFLKMSWIWMKIIPSCSKFFKIFFGIDQKSPNPQLSS